MYAFRCSASSRACATHYFHFRHERASAPCRPAAPRCQIDPICAFHLISVVGLVAALNGGSRAAWSYPDCVGAWFAKIDTDPSAGGGLRIDEKFFPHGTSARPPERTSLNVAARRRPA
jgi:hypothetical protein